MPVVSSLRRSTQFAGRSTVDDDFFPCQRLSSTGCAVQDYQRAPLWPLQNGQHTRGLQRHCRAAHPISGGSCTFGQHTASPMGFRPTSPGHGDLPDNHPRRRLTVLGALAQAILGCNRDGTARRNSGAVLPQSAGVIGNMTVEKPRPAIEVVLIVFGVWLMTAAYAIIHDQYIVGISPEHLGPPHRGRRTDHQNPTNRGFEQNQRDE
jgi:hypothetical protein